MANEDFPQQTRHEWETADLHIREVIGIEFRHRDKALKRQAKEYARRLVDLNHEAARIADAALLSVSSEKFEGFEKALDQWKKDIDEFKTTTETAAVTLSTAQAKLRLVVLAWIATATFAIGLVEVLLRIG